MLNSYRAQIFVVLLLVNLLADNIVGVRSELATTVFDEDHVYDARNVAGDVFFEIIDPAELEYTYRLRPAKDFGRSFNSQFKLSGVALVQANPTDACTKIKNARDLRGNVALIERGECSFLTKTINAEKAGAGAVIISEYNSNSAEFDYYIEMVHDNTARDTQIPAGFMLGRNGVVIAATLKKLKRSHAIINLPVNMTFTPIHKINHPPWMAL